MSHEIRTPMNGVLGFAKLLRKTSLDQNQAVYVQTIIDSAGHLMGSINDILDFSKMEAGKLTLESHVFSLAEAVEESVQLMSAQAASKGLTVSLQLGNDLPDAVRGDALRLKQILTNLLGNAVKFTEQGQVEVRVARQSRPDDRIWIVVVVSDTGIGIPAEVMRQLFQPFSQAAPSTTRLYGGSGLGLSICRRLAEAMGGAIDAKSTEGLGSEFTVTLPLEPAQEATSAEEIPAVARPTADWLAGRVCLVADDNPINLKLIRVLLDNLGAEVLTAVDGEDAVAVALTQDIDIALLDVHMPRLDGLGAAERIAAENPRVPIIVLTADMTILQRLDDQTKLFSACLSKPIDEAKLIEALARTLQLPLIREPVVAADKVAEVDVSLVRDHERAIAQAAGSEAIADALFSDFMDALPSAMQEIRDAHDSADAEQLWQSAHRLQGAAATCSLPALNEALSGLAQAARVGGAEQITGKMADLDREVRRLRTLAGQ
jgi:CheY-like chemotaxis protein/HPt (histidine-containing phosphotransfer) domain-containing protein